MPSRLDTFHAVRVGVLWLHSADGGAYSAGQKETVMNTASQKCQCTLSVTVVFLSESLESSLNEFFYTVCCFCVLPVKTLSLHCFSWPLRMRRSRNESFIFEVDEHNWLKHRCNL